MSQRGSKKPILLQCGPSLSATFTVTQGYSPPHRMARPGALYLRKQQFETATSPCAQATRFLSAGIWLGRRFEFMAESLRTRWLGSGNEWTQKETSHHQLQWTASRAGKPRPPGPEPAWIMGFLR